MNGIRVGLLATASLFLGVTGCGEEQEQKLERAGEHFGKAIENAGDAALDAAEKAGDKLEQWTDQAPSDDKDPAETPSNNAKRSAADANDNPP